ncbi:hypothetical protein AAG906_016212 [Vitis piasezkii]
MASRSRLEKSGLGFVYEFELRERSFNGVLVSEEVLGHLFSFIHTDKDRNAISVVCKSWYEVERWSRDGSSSGTAASHRIVIGASGAPVDGAEGKPHFATLICADGWERMVVTDELGADLALASRISRFWRLVVRRVQDGWTRCHCRKLRNRESWTCERVKWMTSVDIGSPISRFLHIMVSSTFRLAVRLSESSETFRSIAPVLTLSIHSIQNDPPNLHRHSKHLHHPHSIHSFDDPNALLSPTNVYR